MKNLMGIALVIAVMLLVSGCKDDGRLSLVGVDASGHTFITHVNEATYEKHLLSFVNSVEDAILPTLQARNADEPKWELQLVTVGFGVQASIGFGPFKAGISPGIRGMFTNVNNPPPLP